VIGIWGVQLFGYDGMRQSSSSGPNAAYLRTSSFYGVAPAIAWIAPPNDLDFGVLTPSDHQPRTTGHLRDHRAARSADNISAAGKRSCPNGASTAPLSALRRAVSRFRTDASCVDCSFVASGALPSASTSTCRVFRYTSFSSTSIDASVYRAPSPSAVPDFPDQ
jgi:hypothetical protein